MRVEAYSGIPKTIRVAIRLSAEAATAVSATKGLEYGWEQSGTYNKIAEISGNSKIFVRRDAYFNRGIYYPQVGNSSNSEFGPYRIQIGGSCSSSADAISKAETYALTLGVNCYPVYRSGWIVCTGDFLSQSAASSHIDQLKEKDSTIPYSVFEPSSTSIVVQNTDYKTILVFDGGSSAAFQVRPSEANNPNVIQQGSIRYRGYLEFRRFSGSDMTVINIIDMDQYLYSVVRRELGYATTPPEAWKAQAVVARTFAYNNIKGARHKNYSFDICNTSHCQNYQGHSSDTGTSYEYQPINDCVDATKGLLVTYGGKPAEHTYYSSSNGGYTEAPEYVWSAIVPYLKAYKDPYDPVEKYHIKESYTAKHVSDGLNAKGYNIGDLTKIEIKKRTSSGRVLEMVVSGTKGSATITKSSTRGAFGLRSQMFSIRTNTVLQVIEGKLDSVLVDKLNGKIYNRNFLNDKTYTIENIPPEGLENTNGYYLETIVINDLNEILYFESKGNGHGIGMSQLGAMEMGKLGMTYKEIIDFYYKGTNIE